MPDRSENNSAAGKAISDSIPLTGKEALEDEMRILKTREREILSRLERYEQEQEDTMYLRDRYDTYMENDNGTMSLVRTTVNSESVFSRIMKLQDALYKLQGRIGSVAASIRTLEEAEQKMKLEYEKLELARLKATGVIEVPDIEEP